MSKTPTDIRNEIVAKLGATEDNSIFKRAEIIEAAEALGYTAHQGKYASYSMAKAGHGKYNVLGANTDNAAEKSEVETKPTLAPAPSPMPKFDEEAVYVPKVRPEYIPWGNSDTILKIVQSNNFFPTFVTGLSGNGKTLMVEQACAMAGREMVRLQITPETDEDDLMGGLRLVDGDTVFEKGPVVRAMEAGAILLIDEIDRGTNRLMALQGVLEGKPVMVKKTGDIVSPAPGFNVIATANTKGQGSQDGRFIAATVIDEAFLERFTITIDQSYPDAKIETKILNKHFEMFGAATEKYVTKTLIDWAKAIRETFETGGTTEVISTRRLCHIAQSHSIFNDLDRAVELCTARFDDDNREAFNTLFQKKKSENKPKEETFVKAGINEFGTETEETPF